MFFCSKTKKQSENNEKKHDLSLRKHKMVKYFIQIKVFT